MGRKGIAGLAALAALTACAAGCTVRPAGEGGSPVRIEVPGRTPSASAPEPEPEPGSRAPDGGGKSARPGSPAPRVLWSPGDSGRDVRELQARLRQVAWIFHGPTGTYDDLTAKAVRGFQGRRGLPRTGVTDSVTWQRLLAMTHEPGRWELYLMGGQPADAPDPRCTTGRALCISKSSRTLRWMIDGRTVSTMPVRFGSEYTPTREGVFHVYWKSRHHVSTLYDSPMPYAMFFSGGQAVHFSADFAARGYAGSSHGCVNVRDEEAIALLYGQVRNGDKVVVHW
ncbi:L,D-transpeptidase family protein [Streptomyces sp. YIM B13518]|uniref:L,D-transpeptidase family protein n=1 Tax=Streptomyces sp. YIM B13518 TaxID=3366316 RepID=UPI003673E623